MQQKYIRLKRYNEIIIFPEVILHKDFKDFDIVSAGFCIIDATNRKVECFGESISLGLKSKVEDTDIATRQIFNN